MGLGKIRTDQAIFGCPSKSKGVFKVDVPFIRSFAERKNGRFQMLESPDLGLGVDKKHHC